VAREIGMTDSERTLVEGHSGITATSATRSLALTPSQTLERQAAARLRVFVWLVLGLCAAVAGALPLTNRPAPVELAAWIAIGIGASISVCYLRMLGKPDGYTPERALFFGIAWIVISAPGLFLFGLLSPACAAIALGLYIIAPGQRPPAAWTLYSLTALVHAALTLSVTVGWLPDLQMVQHSRVPVFAQILVLGLAQVVLLVSFLMGRAIRRTVLSAIEQHDRAQRAIALRGELLKEAHDELERALHAGGLGRFTDESLGHYRLGSVLGRGGMGEVYEAVDTRDNQRRAVKILYPHIASDRKQLERFTREAQIATSLDGPNVCSVLDVGATPSGAPFLVMDRLDGDDCAEILRREDKLPLQEVVELVSQVARGLELARKAGVVHRDIKPRNLFAVRAGKGPVVWKILDFGVSKLRESTGTLTQGQIVGTPRYMAPEQATGRAVDHRADQFALAAVAYRALTGRPAFKGESTPEILYQVLRTTPAPPSSLVRVPRDVDSVLAIAMAKRPEDRFATALELADALARAARHELDARTRQRGLRLRSAA
jgi:eukaryotic-like serine/threonine-protein kinase